MRKLICVVLLGLISCAGQALAQQPPLRIILPLSVGSAVDVIVRSAQPALSKALGGRTVVVENLPGAGGITGTQALVRAQPDGNTIAIISNNHAVNPSVFKTLPYDSLNDITPITVIGGSPFIFVLHPSLPAHDAQTLQTLMRARPGQFNVASSGNGTIIHLADALLLDAFGAQARHIPYKGMGPMITDMMSGQVDMGAAAIAAVLGQVRAGSLRAVGVMGKTRVGSLPEVPTFAEQGFDQVDIGGWFAAVAPKGLPGDQVQYLYAALTAAFNDAEVKAGFARRDDYLTLSSPSAARDFLANEQARYAENTLRFQSSFTLLNNQFKGLLAAIRGE